MNSSPPNHSSDSVLGVGSRLTGGPAPELVQTAFARELAKLDIRAAPHMGLEALARRVESAFGPRGAGVAESLRHLERQRYGRPSVGATHQRRDAWGQWRVEFRRHCAHLQSQRAAPR